MFPTSSLVVAVIRKDARELKDQRNCVKNCVGESSCCAPLHQVVPLQVINALETRGFPRLNPIFNVMTTKSMSSVIVLVTRLYCCNTK